MSLGLSDSVIAAITSIIVTALAGWLTYKSGKERVQAETASSNLSAQFTGWNELAKQHRARIEDLEADLDSCERRQRSVLLLYNDAQAKLDDATRRLVAANQRIIELEAQRKINGA